MVKRLAASLLWLPLLPILAAEPDQLSEKHYRQAAWAFYQQQPALALETLQLAPQQDSRTQLLEAGLYLQLGMPGHAAELLQQILTLYRGDNALPQTLRNIALLQFARYQLELGDKAQAKLYLSQVDISADSTYLGQQQLLSQLVFWPDIALPAKPDFSALAQQAEMPYIVSNQALILAKQQPELALQWLSQLRQQFSIATEQGFWQQLFNTPWRSLTSADGFNYPAEEQQALQDYLLLIQAQLYISLQDFAAADAILANFASDSVLSNNALELYSHILTEQRHIPALLAVLQQQILRQPFGDTAWYAATRIGEQLERALANKDALAAYRWADNYYQQQQQLIHEQARPIQVQQLSDNASPWQQQQLSNDNQLYRLSEDILGLQQQLNAAPVRQQRLGRLQQTLQYKLQQQQQLLPSQLPDLSERQMLLADKFALLQQQISQAQQSELSLLLTQGEPHRQLMLLQNAEQRLQLLITAAQPQSEVYASRLKRLRGIMQWHYQQKSAQHDWQLQQQQQLLNQQLNQLTQRLQQLQQQGGQTEQLLVKQQRLTLLSEHQQQLNLALLSQQQQLLAQLNQRLQQRRNEDIAMLQKLQRHNKESMARVMETVLAQGSSGSNESAIQRSGAEL
ncbi:hypothetical protein [Rheinheimera maricola]|uniref:Tetratricopeptide repeat protein n=1 Tax=Rheinheimera maricola TaxID=2793282 RepID=A0ABS7X4G0_9GAMM|nr:hypothetical protein [Rheinheimera maricola]MBZ9610064.1 hypothetical protein [Rheinheimera maricola]